LIGQVSAANPKVADYPFTTLAPSLGVVRIAADASFVMADIPGLIVGAADGAGLGAQFLRHLSRTRVLLHLVDVAPEDGSDPIDNALAIESELMQYSEALSERPIWIALSKVDQLEEQDLDLMLEEFAQMFPERPVYAVSALADIGLPALCQNLMLSLQEHVQLMVEDPDFADEQKQLEERISADVWTHSERMRQRRRGDVATTVEQAERSDDFDDPQATEVVYVRD
jgi:GTP-binding protein